MISGMIINTLNAIDVMLYAFLSDMNIMLSSMIIMFRGMTILLSGMIIVAPAPRSPLEKMGARAPLNNDVRSFLFKLHGNVLGINSRVAHFILRDHSPVCTRKKSPPEKDQKVGG